jgi:hypothetical protein
MDSTYRLDWIIPSKVGGAAKMAGGGRYLPKWQALANLVPNGMPNWQQQMLCQKK